MNASLPSDIWIHATNQDWDAALAQLHARVWTTADDVRRVRDLLCEGSVIYTEDQYGLGNADFTKLREKYDTFDIALSKMLTQWIDECGDQPYPSELVALLLGMEGDLLSLSVGAEDWVEVLDPLHLHHAVKPPHSYYLTNDTTNLDNPKLLQKLFESQHFLKDSYVWGVNSCLVSDIAQSQAIACFRHICNSPSILARWDAERDVNEEMDGSLPQHILTMSLAMLGETKKLMAAGPIIMECADSSSISLRNNPQLIDWERALHQVNYNVSKYLPQGDLIDACLQGPSLVKVVDHWWASLSRDINSHDTQDTLRLDVAAIEKWWDKLSDHDRYQSLKLLVGVYDRGVWFRTGDRKYAILEPVFHQLLLKFDDAILHELMVGNQAFDTLVKSTPAGQRAILRHHLPTDDVAPSRLSKM